MILKYKLHVREVRRFCFVSFFLFFKHFTLSCTYTNGINSLPPPTYCLSRDAQSTTLFDPTHTHTHTEPTNDKSYHQGTLCITPFLSNKIA